MAALPLLWIAFVASMAHDLHCRPELVPPAHFRLAAPHTVVLTWQVFGEWDMVTTDVLATFLMAAAAQRCKRRMVIQELASHHRKPGAGSLLHQVGRWRLVLSSQHCRPVHLASIGKASP